MLQSTGSQRVRHDWATEKQRKPSRLLVSPACLLEKTGGIHLLSHTLRVIKPTFENVAAGRFRSCTSNHQTVLGRVQPLPALRTNPPRGALPAKCHLPAYIRCRKRGNPCPAKGKDRNLNILHACLYIFLKYNKIRR